MGDSKIASDIQHLQEEVKQLKEDIRELILVVKSSSQKMGSHIDFVEKVYSTLRYPLDYISKRISGRGNLPEIEDGKTPSS